MTAQFVWDVWLDLAPAAGDHLWQSTLFALAAAFCALLLQKNHARARYWLWLIASLKFLLPFSVLVSIGRHLPVTRTAVPSVGWLFFAIDQASQPFAPPKTPLNPVALPSMASAPVCLPGILMSLWFCGFVVVVSVWFVRWRKLSAVMSKAVLLQHGREVEALRRMEGLGGIRRRVDVLLSPTSLEPGIFGILRPALLWPQGISEQLDDAHLVAIVAHEVCHVRRRDNLAATLHMLVEALFWFHPLVWWLGARLVQERERACDEAVLDLGSDRRVYAESILRTCEFCVRSRLACVSGVTGADLKKRIVHIMSAGAAGKLDVSRKLLLGVAGSLAIALPILCGLLNATSSPAETLEEAGESGVHRSDLSPALQTTPLASAVLTASRYQPPKTKACSKSLHAAKRNPRNTR